MGSDIKKTAAADYDPAFDLPDVSQDIEKNCRARRERGELGLVSAGL